MGVPVYQVLEESKSILTMTISQFFMLIRYLGMKHPGKVINIIEIRGDMVYYMAGGKVENINIKRLRI